ncbi:MAG: NAD(P)/FAD-dependent oxidoreductase, partial [Pseudomonadota bacterium]
ALYLSHIAAKVTLVHRRDTFRAERILQERLFKTQNVELIFDHVVDEIRGAGDPPGVTHIRLRNVKTNSLREVEADGVFVAIGHEPASGLFKGQLAIKPNGYIETAPFSTATSVPGVFAAGDVADDIYRQAVTAAGLGCMAAMEAERFLAEQSDDTRAAAQ